MASNPPLRIPTDTPFVPLSEALTWIAFRSAMDLDTLYRAIGEQASGPHDLQPALGDAMEKLATLASAGQIAMRGKWVDSRTIDENTVLTESIEPVRLEDFAQYDVTYDGLRYGKGLTWTETAKVSDGGRRTRHGVHRFVKVNRADLLRHFPVEAITARAPSSGGHSTAKAENECREWLPVAFEADPGKKRNKKSFQDEAMTIFAPGLSVRGFNRAWDAIARDAGRSTPGRKS